MWTRLFSGGGDNVLVALVTGVSPDVGVLTTVITALLAIIGYLYKDRTSAETEREKWYRDLVETKLEEKFKELGTVLNLQATNGTGLLAVSTAQQKLVEGTAREDSIKELKALLEKVTTYVQKQEWQDEHRPSVGGAKP